MCVSIHYLCAAPGFEAALLLHIQMETSLCGPSLFLPRILLHQHSTLRARRVQHHFRRLKYSKLTLIDIRNLQLSETEYSTSRKCKMGTDFIMHFLFYIDLKRMIIWPLTLSPLLKLISRSPWAEWERVATNTRPGTALYSLFLWPPPPLQQTHKKIDNSSVNVS